MIRIQWKNTISSNCQMHSGRDKDIYRNAKKVKSSYKISQRVYYPNETYSHAGCMLGCTM